MPLISLHVISDLSFLIWNSLLYEEVPITAFGFKSLNFFLFTEIKISLGSFLSKNDSTTKPLDLIIGRSSAGVSTDYSFLANNCNFWGFAFLFFKFKFIVYRLFFWEHVWPYDDRFNHNNKFRNCAQKYFTLESVTAMAWRYRDYSNGNYFNAYNEYWWNASF